MESVGTSAVEDALHRYHAACDAASKRLHGCGVAVRALAGEVLAGFAELSAELDAALNANVEPPAKPTLSIEDLDPIVPPIAEPTVEEIAAHEAEEWHDSADQFECPADALDVAPFVPLNEPVETPEQPAFDVGHHDRFAGMAHEKYPAVPEDAADDSPSLFARVAACSPVQRDDRPRDTTAKQPRRRKGR